MQVVLRCCALRHAMVSLGDDGSAGGELVALLAGAEGGAPLMEVLSPSMLEQVLRMEADTAVESLRQPQKV